ncbi:CTP synthase [Bifidobacterium tissieri]|uniref:CTP synthase n=1 Tax=Bifidobacterium tissieri TaxID=1630162 RepID=A0A261FJG1_9BIFI|nr:CTP synthase [Bifidobacterium tissieri]OZG59103.1 CTP synthase [Bifidobacterium tissieri]
MPLSDADIKAVSRRVLTGDIVRVDRGLYAETEYWEKLSGHDKTRHVVRALAKKHPTWVFCGPTAAIMHRLDCSYRLLLPICIVAKPGTHYRNTNRLAHYPMAHPDIVIVDGVQVTDVLRTLFDCAARLPLRDAVAPLDCALRIGLVEQNVLNAYPESVKYTRRRSAVRHAFDRADGRSENGGESEARAVFDMVGRPVQDVQAVFPCLDVANRTHRVDFLWIRDDGTKVAGEFDGTRKYVDPNMTGRKTIREVVDEERRRQQCLARQGVDTIRFYYNELNNPSALIRKLDDARIPVRGGAG